MPFEVVELKYYRLCQPKESLTNHIADEHLFDTDVLITGFDGIISSFPDLHVESWLWGNGLKPFGHVVCDWEDKNQRLGNNANIFEEGILLKKGENTSLKLGVWFDNMRQGGWWIFKKPIQGDFHCKTTVYFKRLG
jgi:hypothetical protein